MSGRKRNKTPNEDEGEDEADLPTTGKRATGARSAGAEKEELEENSQELQTIHADSYVYKQYRLCARMICATEGHDKCSGHLLQQP